MYRYILVGGFTLAAALDLPDQYPLFLEESNKKMQVLYTAYSATGTIGAVLGGILCHCIPVKCVVISSSIIAFVGGVVTILSLCYTMTVTGLYLFWLGLGSVIVAGLVYVREMSHDKWRSVMLGGFGVLFVFGRFADGILNYIVSYYQINGSWRCVKPLIIHNFIQLYNVPSFFLISRLMIIIME